MVGRLWAALAEVYRAEQVKISDTELGRIVDQEHDAAIAAGVDRESAIKLAAARHRAALQNESISKRRRGA